MQQVKIFKTLEHEVGKLELDINTWLTESRARVQQIFGNISPQSERPTEGTTAMRKHASPCSDIFVVVLYELPD